MMKTNRTPWRRWLALAARAGIGARDFWKLSVVEWRALATPNTEALTRKEFEALEARVSEGRK